MQCRDNNDYHNNYCSDAHYRMCPASEHKGFDGTNILPPFYKNKELINKSRSFFTNMR
jgi:hypothetical protein